MPAYQKRIEMLAEALMAYSGYNDPSGELYQARNPIGLRATSMRHAKNDNGYRIFNSFIDGIQAALFDLSTKLSGNSWAELKPESTLEDLAIVYSQPRAEHAWAKFLRKALNDNTISKHTPLSYFTAPETKDTN